MHRDGDADRLARHQRGGDRHAVPGVRRGTGDRAAGQGECVGGEDHLAGPTASVFSGQSGVTGAADGAAGVALFNAPEGLVADAQFLYLADRGNCTVRQVSQANGSAATLAGLAGACAVGRCGASTSPSPR